MNISDFGQSAAKLVKLVGFSYPEIQLNLGAVLFSFENKRDFLLVVDSDTDSLFWQDVKPIGLQQIAIEQVYPEVLAMYGLQLAWVWEMKNHQGYFDAFQIELVDASLKNERIFQFKAAASNIELFEVSRSRKLQLSGDR